ncbi:hypothetical protein [Okeania sp. KiyG1]|uniref:hypothetical protein n=1 Tax=Okeania sp. KiyG1 TaxID=2720165 RepID=UPI0019207228|nr:hypothetical protein [Okeania sp. KiyG1]GGA03345.1 hypothetical protein CYANOKiyG1_15490 [Okeania sp. KiyG1]
MQSIYFHIISGIFSAIIGWNLSQLFWLDIGKLLNQEKSTFDTISLPPEIIVLPIIAASIAVGMVVTEILVSNPTKHRLNLREIFFINPARNKAQTLPHFWLAVLCGLGAGLISALLAWSLYSTNLSGQLVRVICWVIVGLSVGLAEGLSWRSRSMEGETQRANQRLFKSIVLGVVAGLIAALIVEGVRPQLKTSGLGGYEDVISFSILGAALGLGLSLAVAPSYAVALRAGAGFEMTAEMEEKCEMEKHFLEDDPDLPRIKKVDRLKLLTEDDPSTPLEENLSIQLPYHTKKQEPIMIGGYTDVDIYLPGIPNRCASLSVNNRVVEIQCLATGKVQINRTLMKERQRKSLRHGQIITLLRKDNPDKYYCFCFYDTLYDPQS